ncbi:cupin domain-containing protein [Phyllobacterium sp. 628]|uniref:cupin domain-containing protein n=1 Tax=Phyllobacterium sp. 628 TaxID=2718938 RepID=UPI00166264E6|nr:cupin domain-containing protein [Phyllobacterium sp. 628]QND52482.1 cupin domain-containing protein [Phyllobacterium sp. 628]
MTDKPSALNADGISEPFAVEDVPWQEWSENKRYGSRFRYLSGFGGAGHVGVAIEELAPGMESTLNYYHMLEEEQSLIIEGEMTLKLGDKTYRVKAGDYVCFPAGQKAGHSFYNHSDAPCRFLMIGEKNPNDVIVYPETGRVSVRLTGEGYDKSAVMEYWQGADKDRKDGI